MSEQNAGNGELKPCPFCGSKNIDPEGWASQESRGPACDDCGASSGSVHDTHAENIAAWNTRAPSVGAKKAAQAWLDERIRSALSASAPTAPEREESAAKIAERLYETWPEDAGYPFKWDGLTTQRRQKYIDAVSEATASSAHPAQGLVKALEDLREMMLRQPISEHGRETYSDGFAQGLCEAIGKIDAALSAQGKDNGWFRIDDPENPAPRDGNPMLVTDGDCRAIDRWDEARGDWELSDDLTSLGIPKRVWTHWRPLPAPPSTPSREG